MALLAKRRDGAEMFTLRTAKQSETISRWIKLLKNGMSAAYREGRQAAYMR